MGCGASKPQLPQAADVQEAVRPRASVYNPTASVKPADYTIVGLLGDGAVGRVYLCDVPGGSSVALKLPPGST